MHDCDRESPITEIITTRFNGNESCENWESYFKEKYLNMHHVKEGNYL